MSCSLMLGGEVGVLCRKNLHNWVSNQSEIIVRSCQAFMLCHTRGYTGSWDYHKKHSHNFASREKVGSQQSSKIPQKPLTYVLSITYQLGNCLTLVAPSLYTCVLTTKQCVKFEVIHYITIEHRKCIPCARYRLIYYEWWFTCSLVWLLSLLLSCDAIWSTWQTEEQSLQVLLLSQINASDFATQHHCRSFQEKNTRFPW